MLTARISRLMTSAGVLASALALGACSSTFEANIKNDTSTPVTVRMADANWRGESEFLQISRLAPGDVKRIGPVEARASTVQLQALPQGVATPAAVFNIGRGETALHIVETELPGGGTGLSWKRIDKARPATVDKNEEGTTP